jgi:uncharacterized protein involved in cysteine biosynthesis
MDPLLKQLLEENLKLSKENNVLLLKIRNVQRWAQITKILYWFVIIGVAIGAFYFIQPYLGGVLNIYSGGVSDISSIKDIGNTLNSKNWQNLIKDVNQ